MFHRVLSVSLSVDASGLRNERFDRVSRLTVRDGLTTDVKFRGDRGTDVKFRGGSWKDFSSALLVPLPLRSYMMRHKKAW